MPILMHPNLLNTSRSGNSDASDVYVGCGLGDSDASEGPFRTVIRLFGRIRIAVSVSKQCFGCVRTAVGTCDLFIRTRLNGRIDLLPAYSDA